MTELVLRDEETQGGVQLLLDLEKAGALDAVSLTLTDPEMTYDAWESLGRFFGKMERSTLWWVGDWLIFGEALYGHEASQGIEATTAERYSEAERVTGLAHGTLMNVRTICASIAKPRRRSELGFWIHEAVAKLDADDQTKWLQEAIEAGMTKQQLREAIRESLRGPDAEDEGDEPAPADEPVVATIAEQIETAARKVIEDAYINSDGDYVVPSEAMNQLFAVLGED